MGTNAGNDNNFPKLHRIVHRDLSKERQQFYKVNLNNIVIRNLFILAFMVEKH